MRMSDAGIDAMLKKFEGCKLKAYKCPAGIWTIGYGHTSAAGAPEVTSDLTISKEEALEILHRDLGQYEKGVAKLVKVELTQNQFDVLVDFAYNAGVGNFAKSGILKQVNAGAFDKVPDELMKWTKGGGKVLPGLVKRRQAECVWWRSNEHHPDDHTDHRSEPDTVPVKGMADSKQGNAALVTGGLAGLGAAKEVAAQVQDASDALEQILGLLKNTNFLIMIAICGLGAAIWFWRKKHLEEHGI
ncbi:COG3772 Phage-related lysozyme (muraminidase) [uncultured Caudovirales phage]|uniref:Endolysin n=1 Tax=uncultured Caudovirales phage TaxID=2100421 RepID=A0A6J7W8E8_9CAUD|nr:COG3772 Phage-related lysozyme (muraminidase) [uncultured Caudovirales phage]